ncbi:hypothetical protein thsps117_15640 [Pseudomonas sp. No.117]
MSFFIERIYFENRAPFDLLDINLEKNDVAILSAANGRGKTTVLSHIVDAIHEFAKSHYDYEFKDREGDYYRLVSQLDNLNTNKASVFYLRAKINQKTVDHVNIIGEMAEAEYNAIPIENKIPYSNLQGEIESRKHSRKSTTEKDDITDIFEKNLCTYFPAYRYERPGYINDTYDFKLNFKTKSSIKGSMKNPIEVISGLPAFTNWLMDIVLDMQYDSKDSILFQNINNLLTLTLSGKSKEKLRFGIGPRGYGRTRIQVLEAESSKGIYPTIFNLSSGESALLCLFGEILRHADNIEQNIRLEKIEGVILIDEIDKHLHIKLQREALPKLITIFPNVQFILSSHSPFFSMGLAEYTQKRSKIIDLENYGIYHDPTMNELYSEVYEMMLGENEKFRSLYQELQEQAASNNIPLIVTEGKTDIQHIKKAASELQIKDDLTYFESPTSWGDSKLESLLDQLSKVPQKKPVIGIFDRDVYRIVKKFESDTGFKNLGNNVYAFCLPIPAGRENYENISIEFYYSDKDLKKEHDGKRLYFDNEIAIQHSAHDRSESEIIKLEAPRQDIEKKKKIYDANLGDTNWIHSKSRFASLILDNPDFCKDICFKEFQLIFDKIKLVLNSR